jgi:tetratricopeptide (TPR) repeat protein
VYYKERNSLATIQANVDNDRAYSTFIEGGMLEVIGRAHEDRGSYRMAIAFFEEKLQFLDDKPDSSELDLVAETLNSLGMLSTRAGLYMEAIDYYDKALSIQMKLGCDEVQLAMARVLTGSVQYHLGHFRKALKLFQDAMSILKRHVGPEHETVAGTLYQMGVVRAALCEYDSAMTCLHDALDIQDRILGPDHPATLRTRREIGNHYAIYKTELPSAFEHFGDVLERQKRIHGEKHPNIAETLHSIGCAQARDGDYQLALKTLEDCYNMRVEFLGMDHPLQATTLHEIAKIQLLRGRSKKAIHICDAALQIRLEALSENHIDVALVMATKASCLVAKGSFVEANKLFLQILPMAEAAVGPGYHPSVADIHIQMGDMHLRKCHFEEATASIQKALDMYRKCNLDEDHPGIRQALEDLERVERSEMLCV